MAFIQKIKMFFKFHWLKVLLAVIGLVTLIVLIVLIVVGMQNFLTLESFYKKMTLASIPIQLFLSVVTAFVFASIYMGFHYWFMFGGGISRMGQKNIRPEHVNIKWSDVVGMEGIKNEVAEVISLLRDRKQLKLVGGKIIKGLLMVGPPGCGKTYLAKAIATETGMPFLAAVGSEFIGMFVGIGAARIRSLFKGARVLAEMHGGCLIFIDEIDTIARPRVGVSGLGGGMSYNATVNQLLTELDGLTHAETNIVVVAATNVAENELDPALMRAGRFDRKIYVGKPGLHDRVKLFEYYLAKIKCDPEVNTQVMARKAVGFSPADISNIVREASLIAVRNKQDAVNYKHLSEAYDRVVFGLKSQIILSNKEKLWTAYHEAGHAIIAYLTHPTDDVIKATIVPRKGYLGYVGHRPVEEIYAPTGDWYLANIKIALGSYVAEKLKFGITSSGVSADFTGAMQYAYDMVYRYGMGDSGFIGNYTIISTLSEETKRKLEADVNSILSRALKEVQDILTREGDLFEHFAQELLKKEELDYDEIVEIFKKYGKERPAQPSC